MKPFTLIITAIDAPLYNGEAFSVSLPGEDGAMTVLAHHQAFITRLKDGTIVVKDASEAKWFSKISIALALIALIASVIVPIVISEFITQTVKVLN